MVCRVNEVDFKFTLSLILFACVFVCFVGFDSFSADTAASILTSVKQDLLFSNGSVALAAAPSPVQTQGLASSDQVQCM